MDRRLQPIILRGSGDSPIHLEHRHQTIVEKRIDTALLLDRFVFRRTLGLTIYTFNRSLSSFLLLEEIHGFGIENP